MKISEFLKNIVRATIGPRYTWDLAAQTRREAGDLSARLDDALRWISKDARPDDEQPVFVLSAGWRSGSTLLQRMIMENKGDLLMWGEPFPHCNIHDGLINQFRAFTGNWPPRPYFLSGMKLQDPSDTWVANLYPDVDDLLKAHRSFHRTLFAEPAYKAGWKSWGVKEVRFTIDHANYLRVLYPKSRIILLYRNPYDAYLSYSQWNTTVFRTWPDRFVATPYAFGRNWAELTRGYLEGHKNVDALLVKYEDLDSPETVGRLQSYLGWPVPRSSEMRRIREPDYSKAARKPKRKSLRATERAMLNLATGSVLREAGYSR
jgi:Sulfotransferase family